MSRRTPADPDRALFWARIRAIAWAAAAAIAIGLAIGYQADPTIAVVIVFLGGVSLMIGEARRGRRPPGD